MMFPRNQFEDFQWSIMGVHKHCSILCIGGSSIKEGLQALYKDAGLGGGLAHNRLIAQMAWSIPSTN